MARKRGVGNSKGLGDRSTLLADAKKLTAKRTEAMSRQEVDSIRRHDDSRRDFIRSHLKEPTIPTEDWQNYQSRADREPLLDLFWKQCNRDKTYRPFRKLLQQCVAFQIDDKTSRHISDLATQEPEEILKYLPSAKAPYDLTWIEFDLHVRGNYNYKIGTSPAVAGPETPWRMGHLIRCETPERYVVYTIVSPTDDEPTMGLMPMIHMINLGPEGPPLKMFDVPAMDEHPEDGMIAVWQAKSTAWGWISVDGSVRLPKEANNHYSLGVDPVFIRRATEQGKGSQIGQVLRDSTEETSGDIRWLVCLLAAINEVPILVSGESQTPGRFSGGGKIQPFLKHRTVQLKIGREVKVSRLSKMIIAAARKRAHRVRRHLRIYNRGTEKEFSVWVEPHVRGDASLGWVHQDYEITS
jgi:hypothetical protein